MAACRAVFFLCVMTASSVAHAQGIATSFNELRLLVRPGDTLVLTSTAGREVSGKLVDLSSGQLILRVGERREEWKEGDVSRIRQRRGDSLRNGALWGAVGGMAFIGTFAAIWCSDSACGSGAWVAIPVYGAMGAGVGVGIDALITRQQVIFERSGSARLHLAPILGHGRRGVALSVGF